MRFQIKKYPELNSVVEKMTVRVLIKTVVCPQHRAQNLEMEKGYVSLFLHETTKENAQKFLANYHEEGKPDTVIVSDLECVSTDYYLLGLYWPGASRFSLWHCLAGNLYGVFSSVFLRQYHYCHYDLRHDLLQCYEYPVDRKIRYRQGDGVQYSADRSWPDRQFLFG